LGDQVLSIRVEKSSAIPVYAQIAEQLRGVLSGDTVPADAELPSERLLCQAFGVSRMTLRHAFGVLEREGLIEARRGRGTFVSLPAVQDRPPLAQFDEPPAGLSKLLSFRIGRPTADAQEFLGLADAERVYHIRRLRFAHAHPVALESVQAPQRLCPDLNQLDLAHESIVHILEERYSLRLADSLEEISATRPSRAQRELLEVPASAAILVICRRTRAASGVPALFSIAAYRGDLYTAVRHYSEKRTQYQEDICTD
jgi:GntR family transcriptional regulator